jgi:hypothetical protein
MPLQLAYKVAHSDGGELLASEASPHQQLLERWVVRQICWPSNSPVYPWGIKYVCPQPDGLTIAAEGDNMAAEFASTLVPRYDPTTGDIYGVPGVRITEADRNGIILRLLDTEATIIITGIHRKAWHNSLAQVDQEMHDAGLRLCSQEGADEWTSAELSFMTHPARRAARRSAATNTAWLASGLIRRIGLLRTMGVPLYTTAWTNPAEDGEQWILETQYQPLAPRISSHHETLLHLLNHETWGLKLRWIDMHCSCMTNYSSQCSFTGRSLQERAGELQLRFPRRSSNRATRLFGRDPKKGAYDARRRIAVRVPSRSSAPARLSQLHRQDPEPAIRRPIKGRAISDVENQVTAIDSLLP